jgi:hypothetical protein
MGKKRFLTGLTDWTGRKWLFNKYDKSQCIHFIQNLMLISNLKSDIQKNI